MNRSNSEPVLVLSQDYELFFQASGTVEKCLFEPTDMLLRFSREHGITITFFVDAGMLRCFDRHAGSSVESRRAATEVRNNLHRIAADGHELALHVHPHWEDTRLVDGCWDFSGTRYQLRDFSDAGIADIVRSNFDLLQELSSAPLRSYRAGGFCVEPFARLSPTLEQLGITIDSSVVPGAILVDPDKGFNFSEAPDRPAWFFEDSPLAPRESGRFIEIPVTPVTVSRSFYWRRLLDRLTADKSSGKAGDGVSKAIGGAEVMRRLLGASRTSELSIDDAKAPMLALARVMRQPRSCWHLMGHPKLLSAQSLESLRRFIVERKIDRSLSVAALAQEFRAA